MLCKVYDWNLPVTLKIQVDTNNNVILHHNDVMLCISGFWEET